MIIALLLMEPFLSSLSANEVEFIAENEMISIFPSTTMGILHLISVLHSHCIDATDGAG